MKPLRPILLAALAWLAAVSLPAQVVFTIDFENLANGTQPGENYAAQGVHFSSGSFGVVGGLGNGDPGNWSIGGTAGSKFVGFNGPYAMTVTFDTPQAYVGLDVSRSNGSSPTDTFTLTAFSGTTELASTTVPLPTINVWQTVSFTLAGITSVQMTSNGGSFRPYGFDRLQFSTTAIPEPSTWTLLGLGLVAAVVAIRRRARRT